MRGEWAAPMCRLSSIPLTLCPASIAQVKVTDDGGSVQHAHLRLYRPFTGGIEVHGIKTDENEKSPLKYFQVS